ncbi:glycosyltransferase [Arthrobacter zhaoxinii]|uniref:glycosyltransferase n=1 Tax=Arthrobacter zhaoxinii TaxID=2964616 RepID=UPI0021053DAE|nr:glycosyltransferase [Arthrobacter zhaoxinii]MCQ2001775.1 glycosyltransferase [Arthrobacter zhaoxinii]
MTKPIRVLHVVESYGGGVATALAQYAAATPSVEHHLLRTERPGDFVDGGELAQFKSVEDLPGNPAKAWWTIRRTVKALNPDVVHAHSSLAGAYVRTSVKASRNLSVIYTPHGYAFERKDIPVSLRRVYQTIERVLARNTTSYAACSPREAELSQFPGFAGAVVHVPNVATDDVEKIMHEAPHGSAMEVVSVGRLTPARDPHFFAEVVRTVQEDGPEVEFTWVGGGDIEYISTLQELGVHVTGWLSRKEAMAYIAGADAHLHTASWDGFPMVLLEANAMRVPSLVRDIEPFAQVPPTMRSKLPEEMARQLIGMRQNTRRQQVLALWDHYLRDNTVEVQGERLMSLYDPPSTNE